MSNVIGIDVSRTHLDVAAADGPASRFANDDTGIAALLSELPELGQVNHKESGPRPGYRPTIGTADTGGANGRCGAEAPVAGRAVPGHVAATGYNPVIRACYQRLCAAGKTPKAALRRNAQATHHLQRRHQNQHSLAGPNLRLTP